MQYNSSLTIVWNAHAAWLLKCVKKIREKNFFWCGRSSFLEDSEIFLWFFLFLLVFITSRRIMETLRENEEVLDCFVSYLFILWSGKSVFPFLNLNTHCCVFVERLLLVSLDVYTTISIPWVSQSLIQLANPLSVHGRTKKLWQQ